MNESTEEIIEKLFPKEGTSLIRYFMYVIEVVYPHASIESLESSFEGVLQDYKNGNPERFATQAFATLWAELWYTNNVRKNTDSERVRKLCDKLEKFLLEKLHEELNPIHFSRNYRDLGFVITFFILCNYDNLPEPDENFTLSWWAEENCEDKKAALLPHIETPFIAMLIRYTWYNHLLYRYENDEEYRLNGYTLESLTFSTITKVDFGEYSKRDVCEQYLLTPNCGLREIVDERATHVKRKEDIPGHWYLTLIERESLHIEKDKDFLKTVVNNTFVNDLLKWHKFYFNYLIDCLHNCEEYKDYPIEKLVPQLKTVKPKRKIIDETRALTPLGMSCRKAIIAKIRECKTAADFGALLYKFQYELKFFNTPDKMSRRSSYLCMQQIGDVHFDSSGDFSNCEKGYILALKQASKK